MKATLAPLASFLWLLAFTGTVGAHELGISRSSWRPEPGGFAVDLTFARVEVLRLGPAVDANANGLLDPTELDAVRPAFAQVLEAVRVRAGGEPCAATWTPAVLSEEDGLDTTGRFECPKGEAGATLEADLRFFDRLAPGHRHLAQVFGGEAPVAHVLQASATTLALGDAPEGAASGFGEVFVLGLEHIVFGFDHLVFLFGLLLVGGHWRGLVAVVTAFTVAHSVTLGLAATGVFVPPGALIEAGIAASIVYVGVENFFVQDADRRWRLTLPFGLIHGFGFAGALAEIGLEGDNLVSTLLAFNLGVETGQLVLVALALPVLMWARRSPTFVQRVVPALNAVVIALGVYWFVDRVS
jgi:hydrogenase/urease accessory protein HupE